MLEISKRSFLAKKIRVHQAMHAGTCTAGKISCRREYLNVMETYSESRWHQIMKSHENLSVSLGLVQQQCEITVG